MQIFKNFIRTEPTEQQKEIYGESASQIIFLRSDEGADWYECQKLFSENTAKVAYDAEGVIRSLVDKQSGGCAVSMLCPVDMSVVEIALDDYPADCKADGSWRYADGHIEKIPTDYIADAENKKNQLMAEADAVIAPLERAVKLGIATTLEVERLEAWERYSVLLNRVDTSTAPDIKWPPKPE